VALAPSIVSRGVGLPDSGYQDYVRRQRTRLKRTGPPPERRRVDGKDIELVGDSERVDPEWEKAEAARRRAAWVEGRQRRLEDRRRQREILTIGGRLDLVLRLLAIHGGGMRSRPIAATRRGGGEARPGPPQDSDDHRERGIEQHLTLIQHHLAGLERMLDAEDGLLREEGTQEGFYGHPGREGSFRSVRLMRTEERDRVVFDEFQGVRSEVVAKEAPYLGTHSRTIEKARAAEAKRRGLRVRLVDGVILQDE